MIKISKKLISIKYSPYGDCFSKYYRFQFTYSYDYNTDYNYSLSRVDMKFLMRLFNGNHTF